MKVKLEPYAVSEVTGHAINNFSLQHQDQTGIGSAAQYVTWGFVF
jgi:hypothetical protein